MGSVASFQRKYRHCIFSLLPPSTFILEIWSCPVEWGIMNTARERLLLKVLEFSALDNWSQLYFLPIQSVRMYDAIS